MPNQENLRRTLLENSMPAAPALFTAERSGAVRCAACANRCRIADGKWGICCVRSNQGGQLRVPGGYVAGLNVDPIEKKPLFHVLPGREALSFGMLGCNFHCPFCQNWISSQVARDERSGGTVKRISAEKLAEIAAIEGAPVVVSTYNEPLITADWAAQVFEKAKSKGIICGFVSNGHATPEVLEFLRPVMDLYKVDLKCFTEEGYRSCGGKLHAVLDSIGHIKALGYWVEIVTLVVPGFNNSPEELGNIAKFIAGVSVDIPWHVTAFHPDYKMPDSHRTTTADLERAYTIGKDAGLRFVYSGNLPGSVGNTENTYCPSCKALLIERVGFAVYQKRIRTGSCPDCGTAIPGVWEQSTQKQAS